MLQIVRQNQKWPKSGPTGYITTAVSGVPDVVEQGKIQKHPTSGPNGYIIPTIWGVPESLQRPRKQGWLSHRCLLRGPKVGGMAT